MSDIPNPLWTVPDWLKVKADHGDELPFVFGATYFKTGKAKKDALWESKWLLMSRSFA